MYTVSAEKEMNMAQLMALMGQTYWANDRSEEEMRRAMQSSVCFGAFDEEGNLIAFARVVTDFVSIWYLCDVIVDEKLRGQGIGRMLMDAVVSDERFSKAGALLKTRDAQGFYRQFGFLDVDAGRVMYRA